MTQRLRRLLTILSFVLFPVTFYLLSPYLVIQGASERVVSGSGIVFCCLFLVSLFFGRFFCGWICPAAGLQDVLARANPRRIPGGHWIKFLVFVPWICIIVVVSVASKGFTSFRFSYSLESGVSILQPFAVVTYYAVLGLVMILALPTGRRGFCHYSCWMAPFMMAGRSLRNLFRWPSLRLHADQSRCTDCGRCTDRCPMSIDVHRLVRSGSMEHSDCSLCRECVDGCPSKVLRWTFSAEDRS